MEPLKRPCRDLASWHLNAHSSRTRYTLPHAHSHCVTPLAHATLDVTLPLFHVAKLAACAAVHDPSGRAVYQLMDGRMDGRADGSEIDSPAMAVHAELQCTLPWFSARARVCMYVCAHTHPSFHTCAWQGMSCTHVWCAYCLPTTVAKSTRVPASS